MAIADEKVLVFPRALFEQLGVFQGFNPEVNRYLPALLDARTICRCPALRLRPIRRSRSHSLCDHHGRPQRSALCSRQKGRGTTPGRQRVSRHRRQNREIGDFAPQRYQRVTGIKTKRKISQAKLFVSRAKYSDATASPRTAPRTPSEAPRRHPPSARSIRDRAGWSRRNAPARCRRGRCRRNASGPARR